MNEYMTLIMGAAFVVVLSIVIKVVTGRSLHKKDKKQRDSDSPRAPKAEQPQPGMAAGARR